MSNDFRPLTEAELSAIDDLANLESHEYRLSDWEANFVDTLARVADKPGSKVSTKMAEKLHEIARAAGIRI